MRNASHEMLKIYHSNFKVEYKEDASPVTQADKISGEIIFRSLEQTDILIVSEESAKPDEKTRINSKQIWLLDPLDGTKEFVKKNGEFCINLALIENNKPAFGLICDPINKKVIYGGESMGCFSCDLEKDPSTYSTPIKKLTGKKNKSLIFSRSHFNPTMNQLIRKLEERYGSLSLVKKGSALKFFDLVEGSVDFYPRLAPTMEWDIAAGDAIYRAVNGEVLNFNNFEPLSYNKPDLVNPSFIAKPKTLNIF